MLLLAVSHSMWLLQKQTAMRMKKLDHLRTSISNSAMVLKDKLLVTNTVWERVLEQVSWQGSFKMLHLSFIIMYSLHDVHKINTYKANRVWLHVSTNELLDALWWKLIWMLFKWRAPQNLPLLARLWYVPSFPLAPLPSSDAHLIPHWSSQGSALVDWFLYLNPIPRAQLTHHHDDGGSKYLWNVGNFYQTTWRYNPEDSHLHICHHENLKS
jgi:hypothetical protein